MNKQQYYVYLRNRITGEVVKTLAEKETHDNAYMIVNEYNKGYNGGVDLRKQYPIDTYTIDIWKI